MIVPAVEQQPVILIVEDVKATQGVIEMSLRGLSAVCHFASDGPEGLELASELLPDLIVLDLALPKLTGDEVLRRLRTDHKTVSIPVLVVTAHGQSGMAQSVIDLGARGFMEKPFLPSELRAEAERLLTT